MERLSTPAAMRTWSRSQRAGGHRLAFVPTMGALHAGHASLIRAARQAADRVVVSIFVNPTQFDRPEDLEHYPRTLEADCRLCADEGAAAVFLPEAATMYPHGFGTFVEPVGGLAGNLCAITRPGHFRGVCTVVTKLFHCVEPDLAFFGEKDLQQCLILARMVRDLDFPIELRICPTVREVDGLAMSSRNRRLGPAARRKALGLPRGLARAQTAFASGETDSMKLIGLVAEEVLVEPGVDLDYAHVVTVSGLEDVDQARPGCILAIAAFIDGVRLIDHVILGGPEPGPVAEPG